MVTIFLKVLNTIRRFSAHYLRIFHLFKGFNSPTYCEDKDKIKSRLSQFLDYLYLFFVLKVFPSNYHLFRFDTKRRREFKEYLDEPSAPLLSHKLFECLWPKSYIHLVHDKYIFHCLCSYHKLPVPRLYGIYQDGTLNGMESSLQHFMLKNRIEKMVLKPVLGLMGEEIHFISLENADSFEKKTESKFDPAISESSEENQYIVQEIITQHPELDRINPHSVNSIRIITFLCRDGTVELLAAMLRTSPSTHPIDNYALGGIVVGINIETGKLKKEGFLKPSYGTFVTKHPVTHIEFQDFQLPCWAEIKQIAVKAQKVFHNLKSIGWDFALTPEGPVIIEGNQQWGTAGIQAANGGLLTPRNRSHFAQYGLRFYG